MRQKREAIRNRNKSTAWADESFGSSCSRRVNCVDMERLLCVSTLHERKSKAGHLCVDLRPHWFKILVRDSVGHWCRQPNSEWPTLLRLTEFEK